MSESASTSNRASLNDLRMPAELRAPERSRPTGTIIVLLLVVAVLALVGFWLWRRASVPKVVTATVTQVEGQAAGAAGSVLDASGYVTARRQATVSSKVTGKVLEVLVEEGSVVAEGQVLARLDDSLLARELDLGKARLASDKVALNELAVRLGLAETNLRRTRELVAGKIAAQSQLDADQAEVDSFKAQLATARENLTVTERELALTRQQIDDAVIRAPFAGVAISKDAQPGEMISPVSAGGGFTRTGICTLVDMASLEIEVDVNENYINRVVAGQRVEAVLNAYADWRIPARVITTVPAADRQKATVKVRIGFEQLDPRILPDMGVKVRFLAEESPDSAVVTTRLLVPRAAVRGQGEAGAVFVVVDGKVERRAIRLGAGDQDPAEVLAGLAAGETVVLDPPAELADGESVRVAKGDK